MLPPSDQASYLATRRTEALRGTIGTCKASHSDTRRKRFGSLIRSQEEALLIPHIVVYFLDLGGVFDAGLKMRGLEPVA